MPVIRHSMPAKTVSDNQMGLSVDFRSDDSIISLVNEIVERSMKDHGPSCAAGAHRQRPRHAVSLAALEGAAQLLRALADAPRLQILDMLTGGELCVTEIVAAAK